MRRVRPFSTTRRGRHTRPPSLRDPDTWKRYDPDTWKRYDPDTWKRYDHDTWKRYDPDTWKRYERHGDERRSLGIRKEHFRMELMYE